MNEDQRTSYAPVACRRCTRTVTPGRGEGYFVEIRTVADPFPPIYTAEELEEDVESAISRLVRQLHGMTDQQLIDAVYQRQVHCLCNACYSAWIVDPFGGVST